MERTKVGDCVVQQTEKSEQKYSEMPPTEVKPCVFVKDNKSTQRKPKYKYIDERPSCIPPAIYGQSLSYQWKKKCVIFPSCRSSYSYDTVREVPNAPHQAEDRSNELERSNKSKHYARYVQENNAKAPQRTETELNVNNHRLQTHLISSKHLQSSAEFQTLKDRTNVAVINKSAAATSHSNPVTWRIKELIEIDKYKYETSKKELEQVKQNFRDFIRHFVPTNELQNGIKRSKSTPVSLVLEENEKDPSLSSDNHMKPNSDFKATDARLYLYEVKTSCPSLSIENKEDKVGDSKLRLEMFSIPMTEVETRVLPIEQPCIAKENLELLSFNVPEEKKDQQELEQGVPKPDLIITDGSGIQKLHSPGKIEQQKLELMFNVEETRDSSKQVSCVSGFENEFKGTNPSSIEKHQELTIVETETDELMKHNYDLECDSLEDLDNCLKLLRNDKEKLIKVVEEMQQGRGSAITRNRIQAEVDSLETCSVQNCMCHYRSPIFQNTLKNLGSIGENKSIEMLQPSKLKLHSYEPSQWNLRAELNDVDVAELNSELEVIKSQLITNGQVKLKADNDLKEGLSKNESEALALESTIEEKENQIKELKQHIHDMQVEKNNILLWNINLLCKVQEAKNEARQYNSYVADHISMNEKLLVLAQRKEEEAMFLSEQVARLHMVLSKMTEENKNMFEALKKVAKEVTDLREQNIVLEQHCDLMKLKLQNAETELQKREELMGTISQQVAALFQNQDSLLAEADQLRSQLQNAMYKQVQIESELIYSNNVVNDLKEKICHRDNEMSRLRSDMKQIMEQNDLLNQNEAAKDQDLLTLQNKMANLLHKVQALEEEVMEKEGQIAILKRSFSDEFDC